MKSLQEHLNESINEAIDAGINKNITEEINRIISVAKMKIELATEIKKIYDSVKNYVDVTDKYVSPSGRTLEIDAIGKVYGRNPKQFLYAFEVTSSYDNEKDATIEATIWEKGKLRCVAFKVGGDKNEKYYVFTSPE